MARPPRILKPGAWYHLTARVIERRPIFRDDKDRKHFCQLLAEYVERFGAILDYSAVSVAIGRLEQRAQNHKAMRKSLEPANHQLSNV